MSQIQELAAQVGPSFTVAQSAQDPGSYQRVASLFSDLEIALREYIQDLTNKDMQAVILKLEAGHPITKEDLACIKLWIVGDAEYYVKLENNYSEWLAEVRRIINELGTMQFANLDLKAAAHARAMLEDGKRVIYDIVFFLEKKERIVYFNDSTLEIDSEERKLLISVLKSKLKSSEF